jgi:hypothetical protein
VTSITTLVCGKCGKTSKAFGNPRRCMECGQDSVRIYAKRAEGQSDHHPHGISQRSGAEMSTLGIQTEVVGVSG